MLNIFDHYYDIVSKENLSKQELMDILHKIDNTYSFGTNNTTGFDLYYLMSKSPSADDEVIKELVKMNQKRTPILSQINLDFMIVDNGSEKLFKELWENGIKGFYDEPMKFWRSKYTSSKQLEEIYKEKLSSSKNKNGDMVDKKWLQTQREFFFKHPNAPEKILASNLRQFENIIAMASNPNIDNKPKIFNAICQQAIINSSSIKVYDVIFKTLLQNKSLNWKLVAEGVNIRTYIKGILKDSPFIKKEKKQIILDFCKRPECPSEIKTMLYEKTQDPELLPQQVIDVFIF